MIEISFMVFLKVLCVQFLLHWFMEIKFMKHRICIIFIFGEMHDLLALKRWAYLIYSFENGFHEFIGLLCLCDKVFVNVFYEIIWKNIKPVSFLCFALVLWRLWLPGDYPAGCQSLCDIGILVPLSCDGYWVPSVWRR